MQILHEVNNVNLRDSELLTAVLDMNCMVFYVKAIKREWIYSSFNDMIGLSADFTPILESFQIDPLVINSNFELANFDLTMLRSRM